LLPPGFEKFSPPFFGLDRQLRFLPSVETADERMNVRNTVVFQYLRHTGA